MSEKNTPPSIQVRMTHHQAGRLSEAAAIYALIPEASPNFAHALYLQGLIAQDQSDHPQAIALFDKAAVFSSKNLSLPFKKLYRLT